MDNTPARLPEAPDRAPDFEDDFTGELRSDLWIPQYLPHWTTPDRAVARYASVQDGIQLRIESDQLDWRPEDTPLRVSNLQTGLYSGPVGSMIGTHPHGDDQHVRTQTPLRLLFAPARGRIDIALSASADAHCMTAAWLVGTAHLSLQESGEICIFEIDADAIGPTTRVRSGVKAHADPRMTTDMAEIEVPLEASRRHTWTVIWGDGETTIGCEGIVVRRIAQAPDYPLMLLIDLFEIGARGGAYPKAAVVHGVRAWQG